MDPDYYAELEESKKASILASVEKMTSDMHTAFADKMREVELLAEKEMLKEKLLEEKGAMKEGIIAKLKANHAASKVAMVKSFHSGGVINNPHLEPPMSPEILYPELLEVTEIWNRDVAILRKEDPTLVWTNHVVKDAKDGNLVSIGLLQRTLVMKIGQLHVRWELYSEGTPGATYWSIVEQGKLYATRIRGEMEVKLTLGPRIRYLRMAAQDATPKEKVIPPEHYGDF